MFSARHETIEGCLQGAVCALGDLVSDRSNVEPKVEVEINIEVQSSQEMMIHSFLDEVIFIISTQQFIPYCFRPSDSETRKTGFNTDKKLSISGKLIGDYWKNDKANYTHGTEAKAIPFQSLLNSCDVENKCHTIQFIVDV
ncbi:MAG: Protein archease, variant 2 [Marteilia pararefringens]